MNKQLIAGLKLPFTKYHINEEKHILRLHMTVSDGLNYVRSPMFDRLKPKIGFSSSITNR